ncbi:MAG: FG-GAP repeat protein [Nanoarchaeota archaeon]|nr:FG-GAP repeat protein [Nanoarchaeota archaeon]MBU4456199.1 FG-GAP repeat protein [Nanoarchaeota archaeon]MCG2719403.1 PGF-pre-PGF domain-containing protein [Nanoarchaeota archaeon]
MNRKKLLIVALFIIFLLNILFLAVAITPSQIVVRKDNVAVVVKTVFNGTAPSNYLGYSIVSADFNSDNITDIAFSAPYKDLGDDGVDRTGQVYIFYGRSGGLVDLNTDGADVMLNGTTNSSFGYFITAADVNNDSRIDLIVGAPTKNLTGNDRAYVGQVHIFYSSSDGLHPYTSEQANVTFNGTSPSYFGGYSDYGDFNNDSYTDLAISAFDKNLSYGDRDKTGQVHIFYGSSDGFHSYSVAEANVTFNGTSPGYFGFALAKADFNNDSLLDLAVGAPNKNLSYSKSISSSLSWNGQVHIFYGSASGFTPLTSDQANATFNGSEETKTSCGYSLIASDFNNDNISDLVVSAMGINISGGPGDWTGQVYILYGSNSAWAGNNITQIANITINGSAPSQFGYRLLADDFNNDNNPDLIVGSNWRNITGGAGDYYGQVSVFFGTSEGILPSTADNANLSINGTTKIDGLGSSLSAGDYNNDGIKELSASGLTGGLNYRGQVYIFEFNFKPNNHTAIPTQSWNEDTSITLNLSLYFNDTNNDELNYTWNVDSGIGVSINETTNIITLTPTANWYGTSSIIFYANDSYNSLTASNTVALAVANVNDCGDGTCESGETCSSCQADCGFCVASSGPSSLPKAKHIVAKINANEKTEFNLGDNTIVKKVNVKANKNLENVQIEVKEKASVTNEYSKKVYKYFEIITYQITDDDIAEAEIEFDVEKTWLENNSEAANILLLRYKESWNELETNLVSEDDNKYYFKAKTPGFSDFAISFKEQEVVEEQEEVVKEVVKEAVKEAVEEVIEEPVEEKSYTLWYVLGALVLLGVVGLIVFFILRKKE